LALGIGPGGLLSELAAVGGTAVQTAVLIVAWKNLGECLKTVSSAKNINIITGVDKGNTTV
jgi:hypothetical protein